MNCKIKTIKQLLITLIFFTIFLCKPASAQIPVTDVANLAKNSAILLKNYEMLKIMLENAEKNPGDWEDVMPLIKKLGDILQSGEAIAYSSKGMSSDFDEKFPGYSLQNELWPEQSEQLTDTQLSTLKNVLRALSLQNEDLVSEQHLVAGMLEKSNTAIGHMQAMQQGNAINAANVKQLVKLRKLLMAQINADSVYRAAEISRKAEIEAKAQAWASKNNAQLKPISPNDSRGFGDLEFMNPKK